MSDHDEMEPAEMVRRMMADIESDIVELEMKGSAYETRIGDLMAGASVKEIDMNKAVKIEDAVFLPELGGVWTDSPLFSVPSDTHAVKTLRSAISSGALVVEKPNSKNQFLTRNLLKEWREACQDRHSHPVLKSEKHATALTANSRTKPSGASTTDQRELTRNAALKTLQALKRS